MCYLNYGDKQSGIIRGAECSTTERTIKQNPENSLYRESTPCTQPTKALSAVKLRNNAQPIYNRQSYFLFFPLPRDSSSDHRLSQITDFLLGLVSSGDGFNFAMFYTPYQ